MFSREPSVSMCETPMMVIIPIVGFAVLESRLISPNPVSYTHLDVYKRQILNSTVRESVASRAMVNRNRKEKKLSLIHI